MKYWILFFVAIVLVAFGAISDTGAADKTKSSAPDDSAGKTSNPGKTPFELQIVVDFYDDLLACPFSEKTLDEMMRIFRTWGITRVYWNGQSYASGLYDAGSDPHIDTHALGTYQQIGEFIPAAARLAHKYGMEFYIEFKPFDMYFPMLIPHDVSIFKIRNTWRKGIPALGGSWQMGSVFPEKHPEYLMARNMTGIRPGIEKEETAVIRFVKSDDQPTGLTKETIEIYTSCDNHHYSRYSKPYHYKDKVEERPVMLKGANINTPGDTTERVRVITLSGLAITEPYIAVSTAKKNGPSDFGNVYYKLVEMTNSRGEPMPLTYGVPSPSAEAWQAPELRDKHFPERGFMFDVSEVLPAHNVQYRADDNLGYLDSEYKLLGLAKGKNPYTTTLCPAYPEVRDYWLEQIEEFIDWGADGVEFRWAAHQDSRELYAYGFNAPIVEEYKNRYGVDILRQEFDRVKWSQLLGEYYTEFLRQAKELLARHDRKMMVDVMPVNASPPDSPQFLNIYLDWPRWFTLADGVSFKWVAPDSPEDAAFRQVANRLGVATYYNVWPHVVYKGWDQQKITEHLKRLKEIGHRGFMLYEAFALMRAKPDGSFEITYSDIPDLIVPAVKQLNEVPELSLIPFPKEVQFEPGTFLFSGELKLYAQEEQLVLPGKMIQTELARAGLSAPKLELSGKNNYFLIISSSEKEPPADISFRDNATPEDYMLCVQPDAIIIAAQDAAGLFFGTQTLCQLIRANLNNQAMPCMTIKDWPSIPWRGFQDDITRGPSSTYNTLSREVELGAFLKMNLFTYYMEHQFAFKKHPLLWPKEGALTPEDLISLVEFAKARHVSILGCQQSFGHMGRILKHPEYAHLAETSEVLCPLKDETYQLLDDLYSEVAPLLPLPFFNVCCDETDGLGEGPAKAIVEKIGVGGVYVQHMQRIHDLLKNKYNKRMMMWGDIILQHPERMNEIPKDTIMLSWYYEADSSYLSRVSPFAKAGFDFFVCPSVRNYGRILPSFEDSCVNIHGFIRDGAAQGVMGVINTAWDDGGRTLNGPNWYGYAWGAECSWNASKTELDDFNRRIGAVLFGEKSDHFAQAVRYIIQAQNNPIACLGSKHPWERQHSDDRFWQQIIDGDVEIESTESTRQQALQLLDIIHKAKTHFETCRQQATANADLLDYFLFGTRRYEQLGQRAVDVLDAAQAYNLACNASLSQASPYLEKSQKLIEKVRDSFMPLQKEETNLYLRENRPFNSDVRAVYFYDAAIKKYDELAKRLEDARHNLNTLKSLPAPEDIGFHIKIKGSSE